MSCDRSWFRPNLLSLILLFGSIHPSAHALPVLLSNPDFPPLAGDGESGDDFGSSIAVSGDLER